jgi:hypothetical protein
MDYTIVSAASVVALEMDVRSLINDGWVVTGGVSSAFIRKTPTSGGRWRRDYVDTYTEYSQAMVKSLEELDEA